MIVKYIKDTVSISLTKNKTYKVISIEEGWYRIIDDTGEDYLYPPEQFVIVKEDKNEKLILFIDDTIDAGKEPLPIDNPEAQRIHDGFMEKYGQKKRRRK